MEIIFSVNNGQVVKQIPVPPLDLDINSPQKNEEFQTVNNGTLNLIGNMGLKSFPIESFFPSQRYPWLPSNADIDSWGFVEFFEKYRREKIPFRCFVSDGDREILNIACTVEDFTWKLKRNKDIGYVLKIKEYPFVQLEGV